MTSDLFLNMNIIQLISTILLCVVANAENVPIVEIPSLGKIEGYPQKTLINERIFFSFEGIPYAQPPVGKLRFKEPKAVKPWQGIWQAKTIHQCLQYSHYLLEKKEYPVTGDEDCLYVNVYTPTLDTKANLDVIVYIHGGAFMFLYGGYYGPRYIMDRDVVFINLNYRLGPLGFLSTENNIVPGNNGIRDQNLALQWIKKNVKNFGGNPDSITIFGMSAGGASVHLHNLSPLSKGLYNRGLSQSGTALNPWVLMEQPLEKTKRLAAILGCGDKDIEKVIDCLRKRPARQIVASIEQFMPFLYNPFSPWGVVVDGFWSSNPVLPDHPLNLIEKGKLNDVVWIFSQTDFEGLYPGCDFLEENALNEIETRWKELMSFILDYNYTVRSNLRDEVSEKIRRRYLGEAKLTRSNFIDFIKILSHRLFDLDIQKTAKLQSSALKSPIYFYYFTYRGTHAWYEETSERLDGYGAAHADDTAFILKTSTDTASTEEDRSMINLMLDILISYAKYGVPEAPVKWEPLSKNQNDKIKVLKIESSTNVSMDTLDIEETEFWQSLPLNENENIFFEHFSKDEL